MYILQWPVIFFFTVASDFFYSGQWFCFTVASDFYNGQFFYFTVASDFYNHYKKLKIQIIRK